MVLQKSTKFRRYVFRVVCGWNPQVGVYITELDGKMLPNRVQEWAILSARRGDLVPGTVREFYSDGEMIRLVGDHRVCEHDFDSKSRRRFRVYQVYGPLRGN